MRISYHMVGSGILSARELIRMAATHLLQDLAVVMTVAGATTLACHLLRQPVVLGYLLAGLIIGPHTPPLSFIRDVHSIHTMAELGLVFLMFSLGLDFNLPKLRKAGFAAALAALLEVLCMWAIGFLLGKIFGWSHADCIFLGAILSISSTTIIVKVFTDLKLMKEDFTQAVFGILVLEDIVAVLILSILSGLGASAGAAASMAAISMLKIGFFVVLFLVLGLWAVPRFIHWIAGFQIKEMMGIVILGLCLLGAFLAAKFGFSVALGAFLAGAIISSSREIDQIEEWINPVKDMFSAIFFVSAGMLIQPEILWHYKGPILIVTLVTLAGKVASGSMGSLLAGYDFKTSIKAGMSLAQIGEFSFVIASLGSASQMTSEFLYPLAVAVSSLTTLCTPYLIRGADGAASRLLKIMPDALTAALSRQGAWGPVRKTPGPSVISKYVVRLVVYAALWAGLLLAARAGAGVFPYSDSWRSAIPLFILWTASACLSLPLLAAIAKYANHLVLLAATRIPAALKYINIRHFYNAVLVLFFGVLGSIFLWVASVSFAFPALLGAMALWSAAIGIVARQKVAAASEHLEKLLDEILGLATSEPVRRSPLIAENAKLMRGVLEPIALDENSPCLGKSFRSLRLRERSGANIVALYRNGENLPNPSPDTALRAHDILIAIGDGEEREKAKAILLGTDPSL